MTIEQLKAAIADAEIKTAASWKEFSDARDKIKPLETEWYKSYSKLNNFKAALEVLEGIPND